MKCCKSCGIVKPFSEFDVRGKARPNEFQNDCKICRRVELLEKKRHIGKLVKRWKLRKGCQNCSFKAVHSCQLDLDHVVPKGATGNDRQAINTSWSKKRLKEELSKCQVLCANCHRLKTYEDGTMFQTREQRQRDE
jgi:hypothetical protein